VTGLFSVLGRRTRLVGAIGAIVMICAGSVLAVVLVTHRHGTAPASVVGTGACACAGSSAAPGSAAPSPTGGRPSLSPTPSGGTAAPGAPGATGPVPAAHRFVYPCGTTLCAGDQQWTMYGATVYNPGLRPEQSGFLNPQGTIALARAAHLNTIRVINFYPDSGDPSGAFSEYAWGLADRMIAAAGAAGMHVDLGLGDYRNILWNDCINPYTYDWTRFLTFVAGRRNSVTGAIYGQDPTIAFVSISGEPLQVGSHTFIAQTTGKSCTISYSTDTLTAFYARTLAEWHALGATVLVNSGGLGYINESTSGIDWHSIFALPDNAFCDIKTYGGMLAFASTVAQYCHSIGKAVIDEEFGWQQDMGDAARAANYRQTIALLRSLGFSGSAFWNLGYQLAGTSYDTSPSTPLAFRAVQSGAP